MEDSYVKKKNKNNTSNNVKCLILSSLLKALRKTQAINANHKKYFDFRQPPWQYKLHHIGKIINYLISIHLTMYMNELLELLAVSYLERRDKLYFHNKKAKCWRTKLTDRVKLSYLIQIYLISRKLTTFSSNSISIPTKDQLDFLYNVRKPKISVIRGKRVLIIILFHFCSIWIILLWNGKK